MKNQIATNKDQALRLYAAGVDEKTADMVWTTWDNDGEKKTQLSEMSEFAYEASCLNPWPAWSLNCLLSLLPSRITNKEDELYSLMFYPWHNGWQVEYNFCNEYAESDSLSCIYDESLIEACVKTIEWLHKNTYQLNSKKNEEDSKNTLESSAQ